MKLFSALLISFVAAISEADMPAGDMLTEDSYMDGYADGYTDGLGEADYTDGYVVGYDEGMEDAVFSGDELEYSDEWEESEWEDYCSEDHDAFGDGCDWYAENADWGCEGSWDTDCFSGIECDGCSGACDYRVDSEGDGCDWYAENADWGCGGAQWDTDCFFAADCDGCYGYELEYSDDWEEYDSDDYWCDEWDECDENSHLVCSDDHDLAGDGCDWYAENADWGCAG